MPPGDGERSGRMEPIQFTHRSEIVGGLERVAEYFYAEWTPTWVTQKKFQGHLDLEYECSSRSSQKIPRKGLP